MIAAIIVGSILTYSICFGISLRRIRMALSELEPTVDIAFAAFWPLTVPAYIAYKLASPKPKLPKAQVKNG